MAHLIPWLCRGHGREVVCMGPHLGCGALAMPTMVVSGAHNAYFAKYNEKFDFRRRLVAFVRMLVGSRT